MLAILAANSGQLLLLLLLVFNLLALTDEALDVGLFVEVLPNQVLRESLVENQAVVVLVETFCVDAHEREELGVDHFLCLQDAHLVGEYLAQIRGHFLRLFIQ